ncbi:DUF3566 domain-containing protein [Streptomyces sp. NPDC053079]|uniref:DUF3566 domain-containing protein n=1 Tax=Streptomyces sp. NPDC053079 TaxID=3365697 RepID=UPI0037CFD46E
MSGATGTATGGAAAKRKSSAKAAPEKAGVRGSATDSADGAGSGADGTGTAGRGRTMTETRDPQPYHPPKAYEPPAERSASDSASAADAGAEAAAGSDGAARAASNGGEAKNSAGKAGKTGGKGGKDAKAGKALGVPKQAERAAGQAGGESARRPRPEARTAPRTRKARLRVAKADPWSVMKVSFLLSVALGVCTIVAATVLWLVMDGMGVFSTVGGTISDATASGESGGGFDLESFLSLPHVLLFTSVIAVIDVVLATALATLGAFVYNLSAGFVGGVELTLAEDE